MSDSNGSPLSLSDINDAPRCSSNCVTEVRSLRYWFKPWLTRAAGPDSMVPNELARFVDAHKDGTLLPAEKWVLPMACLLTIY